MADSKQAEAQIEPQHKTKVPKFVGLVEAYYILAVLIGLAALMFTSRDVITYDISTITMFIDITLQAVAIWLLAKRLSAAR